MTITVKKLYNTHTFEINASVSETGSNLFTAVQTSLGWPLTEFHLLYGGVKVKGTDVVGTNIPVDGTVTLVLKISWKKRAIEEGKAMAESGSTFPNNNDLNDYQQEVEKYRKQKVIAIEAAAKKSKCAAHGSSGSAAQGFPRITYDEALRLIPTHAHLNTAEEFVKLGITPELALGIKKEFAPIVEAVKYAQNNGREAFNHHYNFR
jgi:hypothetical protein